MSGELSVAVVDDRLDAREATSMFLRAAGLTVHSYDSAEAFLSSVHGHSTGCLVLDLKMPRMSGLDLQQRLTGNGLDIPIVFLSGEGDVADVSAAFRCGAVDFLQKPVNPAELLERVQEAMERARRERLVSFERESALHRLRKLTRREREVMSYVVGGTPNKIIARHLGVSHRTVEAHRARIMEKMHAGSLVELVEAARLGGLDARTVGAAGGSIGQASQSSLG